MNINKPEETIADPIPESRIKAGIEVGNLAKTYFGAYHDATKRKNDGSIDIAAMLEETQRLMADPSVETICEASFKANGCYCAVDLLHRENGGWAIYEVKSSTGRDNKAPEIVQIWDISFQTYVLKLCEVNVTGTYLMRLNSNFVLKGALDVKGLFYLNDMQEFVNAELPQIADYCAAAKKILAQTKEPDTDLNQGCFEPYGCPFFEYCKRVHGVPTPGVFDLYSLGWDKALENYYSKGIKSYEQLLKAPKLNKHHRMQIESALEKKDFIDKKKIREFLAGLKYPIYHLDFESIQPAIPVYQGTSPYQQIPTQYSLHIQRSEFDTCEHKEFLADAHSANPMRDVAEQLCKDIPMDGMAMVFNDRFEKDRLKEMAEAFPDLREHLLAIHNNVVDLLKPFRAWAYYRPAMNGSFSIKKVLPALFPRNPKLNYHNLPGQVHNGGEAMDIFPKMKYMSPAEEAQTRKDLLQYCELDTWSMVVILQKLYKVSK
jgi:hypothetical protein